MDYLLLSAMVDESQKGLGINGSWISEAYYIVKTLIAFGLAQAKPSVAKWRTSCVQHHDLLNELYTLD
ncbi:hypothetical protein CR513_20459, partial [Mucuna pruriens]